MKKIKFVLILILVFSFVPRGWCAGYGQAAQSFSGQLHEGI